jgi:hypothetical protein
VLHETGIRELRRRPVFTTPNYFPPQGFGAGTGQQFLASDVHIPGDDKDAETVVEARVS